MDTDRGRALHWDRWARWAPLAAIGAVALWVAGVFALEGGGNSPDEGTAAEALAFFEEDTTNIYAGAMLLMAGALLLIWFVSALRARVDSLGPSRLGSVVFGAGLALAIFAMALPASQVGGAFAAEEDGAKLEPAAAQALWYAADGFFIAAMYAAALLVVASAVAVLTGRLPLPRWLAYVSFLLGVWLLIAPIGWMALIFVFPLWLVAVGVLLYLREGRDATVTPEPAYDPVA